METNAQKAELRKQYATARRSIPTDERERRSAALAQRVLQLPQVAEAKSIFVYLAAKGEVQTRGLIEALLARGKTVAVPRVLEVPGMMEAVIITSLTELKPGRFMIDEPKPELIHRLDTTPDLAIIPGLAFTTSGTRLGQGGGYYDRYLAKHKTAHKLGLCFTEQLAESLPKDDHDITMDQVLHG